MPQYQAVTNHAYESQKIKVGVVLKTFSIEILSSPDYLLYRKNTKYKKNILKGYLQMFNFKLNFFTVWPSFNV